MSDKSNGIEKALEYAENNGIDGCEFCKFITDCPQRITTGAGGNPIFPPCVDSFDIWIDEDTLFEKIQEHKESEEK